MSGEITRPQVYRATRLTCYTASCQKTPTEGWHGPSDVKRQLARVLVPAHGQPSVRPCHPFVIQSSRLVGFTRRLAPQVHVVGSGGSTRNIRFRSGDLNQHETNRGVARAKRRETSACPCSCSCTWATFGSPMPPIRHSKLKACRGHPSPRDRQCTARTAEARGERFERNDSA